MKYVNIRQNGEVETVDEFETWKEARDMIAEYRTAYQGTGISPYLSQRATKEWASR